MADNAASSYHHRDAKTVIPNAHPVVEPGGKRHGAVFVKHHSFNDHACRCGDGVIGITLKAINLKTGLGNLRK